MAVAHATSTVSSSSDQSWYTKSMNTIPSFPTTTTFMEGCCRQRGMVVVTQRAIWGRSSSSTSAARKSLLVCSAMQQEPFSVSSSTVVEQKESIPTDAKKAAPPKKPTAVKKPVESLPQMMEGVIPALSKILETEEDISDIELSFGNNKLEGSFKKNSIPHCFWAFFPDGTATGPKGFSLSSHGLVPSTVEPFLIDEKKVTEKHLIFWVEKRLAAQGILPVWKEADELETS